MGPYWLAHHQIFGNIWYSPIEAPRLKRGCKSLPMVCRFSLYTWELNFGQNIWDKSEVPLGTLCGTNWELEESFGNLIGTHREHDGNKGKRKNLLPTPPLSPKVFSTCWAFHWLHGTFICKNCLSPFWAWANGMAAPPKKRKKKKIFPPPSSPERENPDPLISAHWACHWLCTQILFLKLFATIFGLG
jgi:hypothetical protein